MLMGMADFKRISILKIDIEGAELELFASNSIEWLNLADNIVIELHGQKCSDAFFAAIDATRYDISTCGELTVCLGRNCYQDAGASPARTRSKSSGVSTPAGGDSDNSTR